MPDTIPDWATATTAEAEPTPDWARETVPDWAAPQPLAFTDEERARLDRNTLRFHQPSELETTKELTTALAEGVALPALRFATTPLIEPQTSPEDLQWRKEHPTIGGIEEGVVNLAKGFTSPLGIATLGLGAIPSRALQRAIALGFAGQMATEAPHLATELGTEFGLRPEQRDQKKVARLLTEAAGTAAFLTLAAKHGLTPAPDWARPKPLPLPAGAGRGEGEPLKLQIGTDDAGHPIYAEPARPDVATSAPGEEQGTAGGRTLNEPLVSGEQPSAPPPEITTATGTAPTPPQAGGVAPLTHGDQMEATLPTGETVAGTILGADPAGNAILLRPDGQTTVPPEELGTGNPELETTYAHPIESPVATVRGETPAEFKPSSASPTSIKNAQVDAERAARGLPPAVAPARHSFGAVWDEATALIDKAPDTQDLLLDELRAKPRAVTDLEDALLLQHQIDLQNEYGKATRDLADAYDDAQQFPNRLAEVETGKLRTARLSDQLLDLYNINKAVGTETGRGLAARKMMANEDYTLAKMEVEKRAAKGGAPITEAERAELGRLQKTIAEMTAKAAAREAAVAEERAKRQAAEEVNQIIDQVKQQPGYDREVLPAYQRWSRKIRTEADEARKWLKEEFARRAAARQPAMSLGPAATKELQATAEAVTGIKAGRPVRVVHEPDWIVNGRIVEATALANGDIVLNAAAPRLGERAYAESKIRHEAAHHELTSPDGQNQLNRLAGRLTAAQRAELQGLGYVKPEGLSEAAYDRWLTNEFVARQAENQTPWWKRYVAHVRDWLAGRKGLKDITNEETAQAILRTVRGQRAEGRGQSAPQFSLGPPKSEIDKAKSLAKLKPYQLRYLQNLQIEGGLRTGRGDLAIGPPAIEGRGSMVLKDDAYVYSLAKQPRSVVEALTKVGLDIINSGAIKFEQFAKKLAEEFGPEVTRQWANEIWTKANQAIDSERGQLGKGKNLAALKSRVRKDDVEGTREKIIGQLNKERVNRTPLKKLMPLVDGLKKNLIRSGITELEPLIDRVHEILQEHFDPAITRRQTYEVVGKYGDYHELSKDQIDVQSRELTGQAQLVSKRLAVEAGEPVQRSGRERQAMTEGQKRESQLLTRARKEFGIVVIDPRTQLTFFRANHATRLKNEIRDLETQLATRPKAPGYDAEETLLQARLDDARRQLEEVSAGQEESTLKRSLARYEERLAGGDLALRKGKITRPQFDALRAARDAAQAEWEAWRSLQPDFQASEKAQALAQYKSRLLNQEADYKQRSAELARGEYKPRTRHPTTYTPDPEALTYRARAEHAKQEFQRGLIADRLANRPWYVKAQDTFVRWRRGFLLSSPVTLAKLTSAAVQRLAITPIEEGAGAVYSAALPRLARQAPREGGLNVRAEAKALTEGFMSGLKDSWDQLRTGQGQMDTLYGRGREGAIGESDVLPRSAIDFFGHLHGALKAPVKRAEFARSFEKRITWNMARGVDVSDPLVQTRIAIEAYADANRSIFLQDNMVVSAYKRALTAFEHPNKGTGKVSLGGKIAATTARTLLPIVRVPTNIVAETFQYALGVPSGVARLGVAMRHGIETLPPEQADLIMRHLKKGSLGATVLTAGFLLPQLVGGYYQPGKRDQKEVKFGSVRVGDWDVPSYLLHNPLLETLQLGATVRRVAESKLRKKDTEPQGLPAGLLAGALGLTEEVPFIREQLELAKAYDPQSRGAFFGELAKGIAVPQLAQWLAKQSDKDATGQVTGRKPQGIWQHIETGIPGLRRNVPVKIAPSDPVTSLVMRNIKGVPPDQREALRQMIAQRIAAASTNVASSNALRRLSETLRRRQEFTRTNAPAIR